MPKRFFLIGCFILILCYPIVIRSLAVGTPAAGVGRPLPDISSSRSPSPAEEKAVPPAAGQNPTPDRREDPVETKPGLLLVNKEQALPADYIPPDLRPAEIPFSCPEGSPKRLMSAEAAGAIEQLFAQAERDAVELIGVSAYRSYERQQAIFAAKSAQVGEEAANQVSARPGQSEHQTGLAIDVSSPGVDGQLVESFAETEAGRWLAAKAHEFGFIIRYPRGKEELTGYQYEPWHLRYVGPERATSILEAGLTLEEYLAG